MAFEIFARSWPAPAYPLLKSCLINAALVNLTLCISIGSGTAVKAAAEMALPSSAAARKIQGKSEHSIQDNVKQKKSEFNHDVFCPALNAELSNNSSGPARASNDSAGSAANQPNYTNESGSPDCSRGLYIGNLQSMKFHLYVCEYAQMMARSRRVYFDCRPQAERAGMSPCNWCLPGWWAKVEGRLITCPDKSAAVTVPAAEEATR